MPKKKTKQVYNFDAVSGEFISSNDAKKSPLEKDVYRLPANATFDAPPSLKKNEAAIWKDEEWAIVPDHRGEEIEILGDKITIKDLGDTPETLKPSSSQVKAHEDAQKEKSKTELIANIKNQLSDIDLKSIRPIRDGDEAFLTKLTDEADKLRKELKDLL